MQQQAMQQLELICQDPRFAQSRLMPRLLRYLVTETLAGRSDRLKQFNIGVEVFEKGPDFDPQQDPLVRIQVGRLRQALATYYQGQSPDDQLIFEIPKGRYKVQMNPVPSKVPQAKQPVASQPYTAPRLAVLPFSCVAGDTWQSATRQLAQHISTCLDQFDPISPLSYWSTEHLDPEQRPLATLLPELDCEYVVIGQLSGNEEQASLSIRLINTGSMAQLWTRQIELSRDKTSDPQWMQQTALACANQIADQYGVIPKFVSDQSRALPLEQLTANQALLRFWHMQYNMHQGYFPTALEALLKVTEQDDQCAAAWSMLAMLYLDADWLGDQLLPDSLQQAHYCASQAMGLEEHQALTWYVQCYQHWHDQEPLAMARDARRMLDCQPDSAFYQASTGFWLYLAGEREEGLTLLRRGMALNPHYPSWLYWPLFLQAALDDDSIAVLDYAGKLALPDFFLGPMARAYAYLVANQPDKAGIEIANLKRLVPDIGEKLPEILERLMLPEPLKTRIKVQMRPALADMVR